MRRPSTQQLAAPWVAIAREIAERLAARGHRAWIVGGAVRDLALGIEPLDLDMASAARPEEIEACFERTTAVGRAFGTVVVHLHGRDVQLTTFRSERGFSDARHPDEVRYGATPEEDAARRDFTCNALYLDPRDDTLLDPCGGMGDLERRVLRCVGAPEVRFREDGLRLVRLARLAAGLELEVEEGTLEAARASADALVGVSPERVLGELARVFEKAHSDRAVELLWKTDVLGRAVPGQDELFPAGVVHDAAQQLRIAALRALPEPPGLDLGLAILLDPSPADPMAQPGDFDAARAVLDRLKPTRATRRAVNELWRLEREVESFFRLAIAPRSTRVRVVRDPQGASVRRLVRAWHAARRASTDAIDELDRFAAELAPEARFPSPFVTPQDLAQRAVPRGPRWSALLEEAETLQLDERLRSREEALAWLDLHARPESHDAAAHDGGNTPRNANEKG